VTSSTHDGRGYRKTQDSAIHERLVKRLIGKVRNHADDIHRWESYHTEDMDYLIVAYGFSARAALQAVNEMRETGMKIGLWRPITVWPFPEAVFKEAATGVKAVIVPEMNHGQLSREIERHVSVPVHPVPQVNGEVMHVETITEYLRGL